MNNKFLKRIFVAILVVLSSTTNLAFATSSHLIKLNSSSGKLLVGMITVIAVSVVLWIALSIYNKFFVPSEIQNYKLSKDSLRTPADKDEAVIMFLTKNKMK